MDITDILDMVLTINIFNVTVRHLTPVVLFVSDRYTELSQL